MTTSHLSMWDAIAHAESTDEISTDITYVWVFSGGFVPSPAAIDAHLAARAQYLDAALNRKLVEYPRNLGRPYWLRHEVPIEHRTTHHSESATPGWSGVVNALEGIGRPGNRIDATKSAWHLHVFYGVTGVPACPGESLVIALHISHALATGMSGLEIGGALFGTSPEVAVLRGQPQARTKRVPLWVIPRLVVSIAIDLVRFLVGRKRSAVKSVFTIDDDHPLVERAVFNDGSGRARISGFVVSRDRLARGASLTASFLAAMSLAMQRYLAATSHESMRPLVACLPISIDDPENLLGVNSQHSGRIDLATEVPAQRDRASRIQNSLHDEITRSRSEGVYRLLAALGRVPWPICVEFLRRQNNHKGPVEQVVANTVVTSVDLGAEELLCCGNLCQYVLLNRFVGGHYGLAHSVVRTGANVGITVVGTEAAVDVELYSTLLREAINERD